MCVDFYMSDPLFFILFRIISVSQNRILLEYCLILQNKRLAYTESIEMSRLSYFKEVRGFWLDLVHIRYINRSFETVPCV